MNPRRMASAAGLVVSLVAIAGCGDGSDGARSGVGETIDGLPVTRVSSIFRFDPQDEVQLVKFSDEVFVGTVLREVKTKYIDGDGFDPMTVYEVESDIGIDGTTESRTLVAFEGGLTKDGSGLVLPEGDELLKSGGQYLFAGRRMSDGSLHLVSRYGTEEIAVPDQTDSVIRRFSGATKAD